MWFILFLTSLLNFGQRKDGAFEGIIRYEFAHSDGVVDTATFYFGKKQILNTNENSVAYWQLTDFEPEVPQKYERLRDVSYIKQSDYTGYEYVKDIKKSDTRKILGHDCPHYYIKEKDLVTGGYIAEIEHDIWVLPNLVPYPPKARLYNNAIFGKNGIMLLLENTYTFPELDIVQRPKLRAIEISPQVLPDSIFALPPNIKIRKNE